MIDKELEELEELSSTNLLSDIGYLYIITAESEVYNKQERVFNLILRKIKLYRNNKKTSCLFVPKWITNYVPSKRKEGELGYLFGVKCIICEKKLFRVEYV